jgi:hypothetical protein
VTAMATALAAYRDSHEWQCALVDYLRGNRDLVSGSAELRLSTADRGGISSVDPPRYLADPVPCLRPRALVFTTYVFGTGVHQLPVAMLAASTRVRSMRTL